MKTIITGTGNGTQAGAAECISFPHTAAAADVFPEPLDEDYDAADFQPEQYDEIMPVALAADVFPEPLDEDYDAADFQPEQCNEIMPVAHAADVFPEPIEEDYEADFPDYTGEIQPDRKIGNVLPPDYSKEAHTFVPSERQSSRAQRLYAPAIELYGNRWQHALARASGVSQPHLQRIASGSRAVTDTVENKVVQAYLNEIVRKERATARAKESIACIIAARKGNAPRS